MNLNDLQVCYTMSNYHQSGDDNRNYIPMKKESGGFRKAKEDKSLSAEEKAEIETLAKNLPKTVETKLEVIKVDAKQFLSMIRKAKTREEKIHSIKCFIGYHDHKDYGPQEQVALMKAKKDLNPKILKSVKNKVNSKVIPVIGMPNVLGKKYADLEARERNAMDLRDMKVQEAKDKLAAEHDKFIAAGQAALEQARINHIKQEKNRLVN